MYSNKFCNNEHVILKSNDEIDTNQFLTYVKENWNKLIHENTRFLILTGIHGKNDGKLGSRDNGMLLDYEFAINGLKKDFEDDIKDKNVQIILEDVGSHVDSMKLDEDKFVAAVKKHNPTLISLSFCHTDKSELNDILRSAGIYAVLIITQDKSKITEGKYVFLDDIQRQIIDKVANEKPQNIILWGSHGTGKTLLLAQTLVMKISNYKKQNLPIQIIVSSYSNDSTDAPLMQDLKTKYLAHIENEIYVDFVDFLHLCEGILIAMWCNITVTHTVM